MYLYRLIIHNQTFLIYDLLSNEIIKKQLIRLNILKIIIYIICVKDSNSTIDKQASYYVQK